MKYSIGILICFFVLGLTPMSKGQKIALVDIAYVLDNMDEYKQAQTELDKVAEAWQQEIAVEQDKIKSMYNKYQAELVLLSDEMKKQKEDEIMALVSPIQEKVYGAIQAYATDRGYDIIIDKGGSSGVLFSDVRFDKTDDILRALKN